MEELKIFFIALIGVIALAGLAFFSFRRSPKEATDAATDYAAGLNYLLSGDATLALKKLRDAVRKDTTNVDAYIKIGDILRENGSAEQAVKVHRDLTARTTLNFTQRLHVFRSMVLDYEILDRLDLAHKMIEKILSIKSDDLWAKEKQLDYFQKESRWDDAVAAYKALSKQKGGSDRSKIASFSVAKAQSFIELKREKDARIAFREAIKIDPECVEAYLGLKDSYIREDRKKDALKELREFANRVPSKAALVFEPIKDLLFEIGEFGEIENFYKHIIDTHPQNWDAYLALAEIKVKKGAIDRAIQLCQQVLQNNPDFRPAREHLIRYYHQEGKDILAVEQALMLINKK